jgi:hypothetical protein
MKTATSKKWQEIADQYVATKRHVDEWNRKLEALGNSLKDHCPVKSIYGRDYSLEISDETRQFVTKGTIAAELGMDWFDKHATTSRFQVIRVSRRQPELVAA